MRLAFAILVSMLAVSAQPAPDAAALLNHRFTALTNYYSYQFTETISGMAMTQTMVVHAVNPDRYRMDSEAITVVKDGNSGWMYVPMFKKYSRLPDNSSALTGGPSSDEADLTAHAKVIRSETLEIDGQPHDCWVVESRSGKVSSQFGEITEVVETIWIDKTLGIDVQTILSFQMNGTEGRTKSVKSAIKFNQRYPDSMFTFTPPAGAVEADEVVPGMRAMLAPAKAKPFAPATVPAGVQAQAFVPNLIPTEQKQPAPVANAQGMVQLLVTIDPAGFVVKAEALTGPLPLRQPAIDSVMDWKFRRVIRNGQPVYAFTEATVNFIDQSKPLKAEDFNVTELMAFGQRTSELQQKFPRSPQQVLADLEQDHGALPKLAQAAVDAGALEKASEYAHEMLHSNPDGQAVHDGNMVLGLIALKQGDVEGAKSYLLESGKSKGSPVLGSFGPNMKLAKALLEKGEKDAVLQYFSECRTFWKMGAPKLDEWTAEVRQGSVPEFGANLVY